MLKKSIILVSLLFPIFSFATPVMPFPPEPPILGIGIGLNVAYNGDDDDVWFEEKKGDDDDVWLHIK